MKNSCRSSLTLFTPDRNGCVYQSVVAVRGPVGLEGVQALPRSLRLRLPVGELGAASAVALDEAHVAVVGMPHPSARTGKGKYQGWDQCHVNSGAKLKCQFSSCGKLEL